ncbi:MAG: hypothetical protein GY730_08020 [bacterium]|nr:hypothetical protein [bacterium]
MKETNFNDKEELDVFLQDLEEYIDISVKGVTQVNKVANIMSKYSYIQDEGKFKMTDKYSSKRKINLNESVEETIHLAKALGVEKKVELHLDLNKKIPVIYGYKEQLNQIILNVVLNALQAIENGGTISIKTAMGTFTNKEGVSTEGIRIDVIDSGKGMSEEEVARMFDPFFTTKYEGAGLGLSIVFGVVDEHDGMIDVQSEQGKGTTFTIYFSVIADPK